MHSTERNDIGLFLERGRVSAPQRVGQRMFAWIQRAGQYGARQDRRPIDSVGFVMGTTA